MKSNTQKRQVSAIMNYAYHLAYVTVIGRVCLAGTHLDVDNVSSCDEIPSYCRHYIIHQQSIIEL